jgi:hypothetical protein
MEMCGKIFVMGAVKILKSNLKKFYVKFVVEWKNSS